MDRLLEPTPRALRTTAHIEVTLPEDSVRASAALWGKIDACHGDESVAAGENSFDD